MRLNHAVLASIAFFACGGDERTVAGEHALSEPTQLCREGAAARACRKANDVEALLQREDLEILAAKETSTGVQRASVLTLRADGVVFRAKWRAHSTTTTRNSPRFELAAYAVQKLFLEPREYVVPPTAAHCFPLAGYRARVDRKAQPTFAGSGCVYGVLSYWLEDVSSVSDAHKAGWFDGAHDHAFDPRLFERSPLYRDSIGRVNVFTYVVGHRDSHARNFVLTRSEGLVSGPHVYSIDNSLSFTMAPNPRIKPEHDWSKLQVPALPRDTVERLRRASDQLPSLGAVAVLRRGKRTLVPAPDTSVRTTTGIDWSSGRLVVGLTTRELEGVRARIAELLTRVDRGELRAY